MVVIIGEIAWSLYVEVCVGTCDRRQIAPANKVGVKTITLWNPEIILKSRNMFTLQLSSTSDKERATDS